MTTMTTTDADLSPTWLKAALTILLITQALWSLAARANEGDRNLIPVAGSNSHMCGLLADGSVRCWGSNYSGEGSPPVGERFIKLAMWYAGTCGLHADGTARCWGYYGDTFTPRDDRFIDLFGGPQAADVCGLRADGSAICWPNNRVPSDERFTAMAVDETSCGLRTDGSALCWGVGLGVIVPAGERFIAVAGGSGHACGLRLDGSALCWGEDIGITPPVTEHFVSLAASGGTICGLHADGTARCWGPGGQAPVGRFTALVIGGGAAVCGLRADGGLSCAGNFDPSGLLAPPAGAFTTISSSRRRTCGLRTDGTASCWGSRLSAALPAGDRFIQVVTGDEHVCGLHADGSAVCPDGHVYDAPITPPAGEQFVNLASGGRHICGLRADHIAICWGEDRGYGALAVPAGEQFDALAAGASFTCGLRIDGSAICWGQGTVTLPPAGQFGQLVAGAQHACGLRADGTAMCWGSNNYGQATVPAGEHFAALMAADAYTCGLHDDGSIVCWGQETAGQFQIPQGEQFTALTGGTEHLCGLRSDGTVLCWGVGQWHLADDGGPYGIGNLAAGEFHTCNRQAGGPVACWPLGTPVADNAPVGNFAHIYSGGFHACALGDDGTASCWGDNEKGQIDGPPHLVLSRLDGGFWHTCGVDGDGTPACWGWNANGQASPPAGTYREVSAGFVHSCGVLADNTGVCWGYDGEGETDVPADLRFRTIGAGDHHSCGLLADGTLVCWGSNSNGQATPPTGAFAALAVSSFHNCAIRDTGTLACWGDNGLGQADPPAGDFVSVSAGYQHSCAIRDDGVRVCWGDSASGQFPELSLQPDALSNLVAGTAYAAALALEAISPNYVVASSKFSVTSGSLPPGLTLTTAGYLSGIATTVGDYSFTIEGRDANGFAAQRAYEITVSQLDNSPPSIDWNTSGRQGRDSWYTSNVDVSWLVEDPQSPIESSSGCNETLVTTDGRTTFTCTAASAGGTSQSTLQIERDTTPPDTTITKMPTDASTSSDASFEYDGTDATSGVNRFECSLDGAAFFDCELGPFDFYGLANGSHSFAVRAVDAAGLRDVSPAVFSWTIQVDNAAPQASPILSQPANANGWHRANVTVTWNWSDAGTGVDTANCVSQTTSSGEGAMTLSANCQDVAGNVGTASVQVKIDRTAPTLAPSVTPAKVLLNGAALARANGSDARSGIDTQACDPVATSSIGTKSITCTVVDAAGNKATSKISYRVVYGFVGFTSPVGNPPVLNLLRTTAIAPLRWRAIDANGAAVTDLKSAVVNTTLITCPAATPRRVAVFATSTKLVNLGNGNYELGWKPAKSDWGKCRRLDLTLADGESYSSIFRFD